MNRLFSLRRLIALWRKELVQIPSANEISVSQLVKLFGYATKCGATEVAEQIMRRVEIQGQRPGSQLN